MLKKDKLIQEKYNGIHPTCNCGCGKQTRYEPNKKDFCKWVHGHQAKIKGHFGDPKSKKRVNAISKTRKEKFKSGEYNYIKEYVSKPRSKEIKDKISKTKTGVSSPKPEGFGIGRKHSEETKQKMSESAIQNILKSGKVKRSNLELIFEGILCFFEVEYIHSHYIKEIGKIYDFYIPKYNILIEVDGDFWHCNPSKYENSVCKTQELNLKNDEIKNDWARDNGYKLLRFWEDDIMNNIKSVKKILLENLK